MIEACQVQHAVQHKDFQLFLNTVSQALRLCARKLRRNRDVPATSASLAHGKRQHIGGSVFAAEIAVEDLEAGIGSDQNVYLGAQSNFFAKQSGKALQGTRI